MATKTKVTTTLAKDNDLQNAVSQLVPPSKKKKTIKNKTKGATTKVTAKATETKPLKKTKSKKTKADPIKDAVAIAATQKTVLNKPLKYIYPKGCIAPQDRKSHRQKIRKQNTSFLAKIASAKIKDKKDLKQCLNKLMLYHIKLPPS